MGEVNCPECDDSFSTKAGMKIHYGQSHEGSISGVESICECCSTTFRQKSGNHIDRDKDFCSRDCYYEWMGGRTGSDSFAYKSKTLSCQECGSELERQPNVIERNDKHFCDFNCRADYQSKNMCGADNHNFNPDYDRDYGDNWDKIRDDVLRRDFYRCRCCRISNSEHKRENGISLDVHHRTPLHYFDSKNRANRLTNLISLCRKCHSRIEANIESVNNAESA